MKRASNYLTRCTIALSFAAGLLACNKEAKLETVELPGGFKLGSSLEEAQRHASSRGWELVRLSPELPGQWEVEGNTGTEVGLLVCDDTVTSVHHKNPAIWMSSPKLSLNFGLRAARWNRTSKS